LDAAAREASGGKLVYDRDGRLARQGIVSEGLLRHLLAHPFFSEEPPRSTGREVFGRHMVQEAMEYLEQEEGLVLTPGATTHGWPDLLATLVALTAQSIGDAYRRWVLPKGVDEVFLLGGGSRNPLLADAIAGELEPIPVLPGEDLGMDPDAREAAAFALMAWAHLRGVPANVPEATGSQGPRILGSWTPGRS
jgi:anhydro-N-acetylmuramic acid kinase